jgi:hypothetical protein
MASTSRTTVGRRLGVLLAGAVVLTALSVATAGAVPSAPTGVRADPSGAFIYSKGRHTPLDALDGRPTGHTGINNRGQIVGGYDADGMTLRGFVRDEKGNYTSFDAAPGVLTAAFDINDRGTAVGTSYGVTEVHGFFGGRTALSPPSMSRARRARSCSASTPAARWLGATWTPTDGSTGSCSSGEG